MKKIILLFSVSLFIITILISNQIKAQPTCAWAKKAGSNNEDFGIAVAADAFGNVYYLGGFYSQTIVFGSTTLHNQPFLAFNYGAEMFLVKYDSCGNFKWAKQAGGNSETRGRSIVTDPAGNVYVSGYSNCDTVTFGTQKLINKYGYNIAFVVKYDASGTAVWAKQASGYDNSVRSYAIAVDGSSNVYITGNFSSTYIKIGNDSVRNEFAGGNASVFIAKFDNSGTIQWVRGGGGDYDAYGFGIGTDASGNVYVGGTFGSSHIRFGNDSLPLSPSGYYDIFVVKYNTNGTEQWLRSAGAGDDDEAKSLATDASGNVYITGFIGASSTVTFGTHPITNTTQSLTMFLARYDASGTAQWARISQGDYYTNNEGYHVTLDASGNPYVIGFYNSDSLKMGAVTLYNNSLLAGGGDTLYDIFVAKYKANGILSWARTAGGVGNDLGYGIATGAHNSIYITGEFLSPTISFSGISLALTAGSLAGDGDAFIANNIATSPVIPDICMVTVDTVLSKNNIIVWDKTPFVNFADSFIIYREITTNVYKPIGAVPYSALSYFTDTVRTKYYPNTGNPNSGTYRYKIAIRDTSGIYSMLSPFHNTIYIVNNAGTFTWQQLYTIENSANPVTSYDLMRDDNSNGNWHTLTSVAGSQQNVIDPNYTSFSATASWRVQTAWNISCSPTIIKNPQPMSINLNSSRSNVYRTTGAGIQEYGNELQVQISPNPSNGIFMIKMEDVRGQMANGKIEIYNTMGEKVYSSTMSKEQLTINLGEVNSGIYFLNVKTDGGTTVKKIIKE